MLPYSLDDLDESVFVRACSERWSEGFQVDFKRDLPGTNDKSKDEFLKDVCAMANAEGGDLVYGLDESNGHAHTLCPISSERSDDALRRLGQMLDSSIEPRIVGVQLRSYPVDVGYVLVVRVPASFDGPHRYWVNNKHRFVVRNNTHTHDMGYDQLRGAFGRTETLMQRARTFIGERVAERYKNAKGACYVVHLVPISGIAGRINLDIASLHKAHELFLIDKERLAWTRRANRNGLVLFDSGADTPDHFTQVFRNGCFEVMREGAYDVGGTRSVVGRWASDVLLDVVATYGAAARATGIAGPGLLSLNLIQAHGTVLATSDRRFTNTALEDLSVPIDPVELADVSHVADAHLVIKPIMDVLFQSYGVPSCEFYDANGTWVGERRR